MIHFKDLQFRNFLSVGDQPTKIQLDKTITTVITGENGAGKSTFIDALVYVLFGKPYRKVKLGQLVNKVNEKGLEVEVNFSVGSKDYKVIRGQKPAKFEIWSGGDMIEQPATTADYQYILENDILKLNYKSFTQIIILGSASFVPFMQLKLADRREIIEDLLDISVFSQMNTILKSKIKTLKEDITDTDHKLDLVKQDHKSKRDYLNESTEEHNKRIEIVEDQISTTNENIRLRGIDKVGHEEYIDKIENSMLSCEGYEDKVLSVMAQIQSIKTDISEQQTRFDLLEANGKLEEGIKKKISDCEDEISEAEDRLEELRDKNDDLLEVINHYPDISDERTEARTAIITLSNSIVGNKIKLEFYQENDSCPECKQDLEQTFTEDMIGDLESVILKETEEHDNYQAVLEGYDADIKDKTQFTNDSTELTKRISLFEFDIGKWQNSINVMTESIKTLDTEDVGAMGDLKHYIGTLEKQYKDEKDGAEEAKEKYNEYVKLDKTLTDVKKKLAVTDTQIKSDNDIVNKLTDEHLNLLHSKPCSISQEDIDVLSEQIKDIDLTIIKKKHMMHYYGIVQRLLKDDGLKTKIIRKFLPVINATVNMYLDKFDFPINFEFDENFNETIQSKFRNDFSYFSFSEGEKSRIDLALLFTWRETSLKKARNATNIIIFDEIFDGSLDGAGIENFMSILGLNDDGYNSFIISHKDETINSRFDRNLTFEKTGHFSKIKEN